jgi:hypothetical protein
MFWRYALSDFPVYLLVDRQGVADVLSFQEQLALPEIGQSLQVSIPVIYNGIEDWAQNPICPDFGVKTVHEQSYIGAVSDIMLIHIQAKVINYPFIQLLDFNTGTSNSGLFRACAKIL